MTTAQWLYIGCGFLSYCLFAPAKDIASVINVIQYYYCFYHLVMPPKRATTGRTVGLGNASKKTLRLNCGGMTVI